jgi:hypothetical protein
MKEALPHTAPAMMSLAPLMNLVRLWSHKACTAPRVSQVASGPIQEQGNKAGRSYVSCMQANHTWCGESQADGSVESLKWTPCQRRDPFTLWPAGRSVKCTWPQPIQRTPSYKHVCPASYLWMTTSAPWCAGVMMHGVNCRAHRTQVRC